MGLLPYSLMRIQPGLFRFALRFREVFFLFGAAMGKAIGVRGRVFGVAILVFAGAAQVYDFAHEASLGRRGLRSS